MQGNIARIGLHHLYGVNCYAVKVDDDYILIDTGFPIRRLQLDKALREIGCRPGRLRLIVLTHAHTDHAGNCAHLRESFEAPIAMHEGDVGRATRGDMFWRADGRKAVSSAIAKVMLSVIKQGKFDAFEPDVLLSEGDSLSEYGLDARVLHFPGHSPGSIGILTADGDLFCGDLLTNNGEPLRNTIVDEPADMDASYDRLAALNIQTVYPGHGEPFAFDALQRVDHDS